MSDKHQQISALKLRFPSLDPRGRLSAYQHKKLAQRESPILLPLQYQPQTLFPLKRNIAVGKARPFLDKKRLFLILLKQSNGLRLNGKAQVQAALIRAFRQIYGDAIGL